ncbi:MAG TPA: FAD-binding oxidoreductase [Kofleriaceae bacterium]|nr:FAD-binding oxidoreductase [Kofleriaceae bacterium]
MTGRERSFWGWGWADAFPPAGARRATGDMVSALLGGARLELREPPSLDGIQMQPPRVAVPAQLSGFVTHARDQRARHTYGRAYPDLARGFAGRFEPAPDLVASPPDEDAIWALFDFCAARRLALIPFGGGTSVVGGVEADVGDRFAGAVSVDLGRLARVIELDPVSRAARIQAGSTGPALEAELAAHGMTLRHYPQSFEFSTLGGWIATRAGGHFATLYTHIDDLVESVRMLTPRGVWESRRLPASGAGPSPDRMVLGSEGILGVITEAWMRVRPRPRWRASASMRFRDFGAAVQAARELAQSDLYPSNCRLLDATEAMLHRVVADGTNVLLIGFESADHPLDAWMARALEIARARGGTGEPRMVDEAGGAPDAAGSWRAAFLDAPYLFNTLVSLGCVVDTFETACTWSRFDELHAAIRQAVTAAMKAECGGGVMSCRFTHVYPDGPAPYYTFIAPGRSGAELTQWRAIKTAASDAILAHGGTITHHHAVGRTHRPWYERQRPEPFALALRGAKRAVDPDGLLNPGVLLAPE